MTYAKLTIKGGLSTDRSDYSAGPVWVDGDNVRFQQGLPEKIGGWNSETGWTHTGAPSRTLNWVILSGESVLAVGTNKKLQIVFQGTLYDITPIASTAALTNPFDTTSGSPTINVHDIAHSANVGDYIVIDSASAVGGITPDGEYVVQTVVDSNEYTITHGSNASSTVAGGGGSPNINYLLATGQAIGATALGWGTGSWGDPREGAPKVTATITAISQAVDGLVTTSAAHGWSVGDIVKLTDVAGMTEVNGVTYTIATVPLTTTFTIGVNTTGYTAYTSGGTATQQFGWGYSASLDASSVALDPSLWSLDLWGEDLIATRRGGLTYRWNASAGPDVRAAIVDAGAPITAKFSIVGVPERQIILFGAHDGAANDPLLVAWCDTEDYTTWTAASGNTAGTQRLNKGLTIMAAVSTKDQIIILTDRAAFSMYYQGPPYIYGFRQLGSNCGAVGQGAIYDLNGIVFWIGRGHFYIFDGAVRILPSPLHDYFYDNLNEDVQDLCFIGHNSEFSELLFFFPTIGNDSPNKYVTLNYANQEWSKGTLSRNTWIDKSVQSDYPIALSNGGTIYYHEQGSDADGSVLAAYIESGDFELPGSETSGPGEKLILIDKLIPDATIASGSISTTLYMSKYPASSEVTKGPYTITSSTKKLSLRAKGRLMRMRIENTGMNAAWKWGYPRIDYRVSSDR